MKPEASEMPHHAKHHASENRRAIERSLVTRTKNVLSLGEGRLWSRLLMLPRPTVSDAHILRTSLSPSCASLQARTLAWCFASFGISDAYQCFCFSFPHKFSLNYVMGINFCPNDVYDGDEKIGCKLDF